MTSPVTPPRDPPIGHLLLPGNVGVNRRAFGAHRKRLARLLPRGHAAAAAAEGIGQQVRWGAVEGAERAHDGRVDDRVQVERGVRLENGERVRQVGEQLERERRQPRRVRFGALEEHPAEAGVDELLEEMPKPRLQVDAPARAEAVERRCAVEALAQRADLMGRVGDRRGRARLGALLAHVEAERVE